MSRELALEAAARCLVAIDQSSMPTAALTPSIALAWAESGFAAVEPSHRLAASLMATSVPQEHIDEFVRMPWRCFGFKIPSGLLAPAEGFMLALHSREGLFLCVGDRGDGNMQYGVEQSLAGWNRKLFKRTSPDDLLTPEEVDQSARTAELVGRLFVGICVELSEHRPTSTGTLATTSSVQRATKDGVTPCVYKLTRNVTVDARPAIRDFVAGRRPTNPTVQVLVRGHWKLQAHGSASSSRKLIHVEPYWRGDDAAPVAVRSHVLTEEKGSY